MKKIMFHFLFLVTISTQAQERTIPKNQPQELGKVSWLRDYDNAIQLAKEQRKAVLILFQEVPGCATCQGYGKNALSHPLMVEAIENSFVPLVIYNNKGGKDGEILKRYNEPTWNNPVVRIVDETGTNLINRVSGDYSALGLYKAMFDALIKQKKPIPEYMKLLRDELSAVQYESIEEKTFQMYCFWSGEKHLGALDGVLNTTAGFANGHEVVKVTYDTQLISEEQLTNYAKKGSCSPTETQNYRKAENDHLFYLKQTHYKYLPLTDLQKTKINSALGNQQSGEKYLSPKQLVWLKQMQKSASRKSDLLDASFEIAWQQMP